MTNLRKERIEKMLEELRYEITVGMMQGEIPETLTFKFIVRQSKEIPGGIVVCEFRTRPAPSYEAALFGETPGLKVVKP